MFDKKPAEEFHYILENLHEIAKYPDIIYRNKQGKRGNFSLVKKMPDEKQYICALEIVGYEDNKKKAYVVTAFRIRDEKYLKDYETLWSRKDDIPSS